MLCGFNMMRRPWEDMTQNYKHPWGIGRVKEQEESAGFSEEGPTEGSTFWEPPPSFPEIMTVNRVSLLQRHLQEMWDVLQEMLENNSTWLRWKMAWSKTIQTYIYIPEERVELPCATLKEKCLEIGCISFSRNQAMWSKCSFRLEQMLGYARSLWCLITWEKGRNAKVKEVKELSPGMIILSPLAMWWAPVEIKPLTFLTCQKYHRPPSSGNWDNWNFRNEWSNTCESPCKVSTALQTLRDRNVFTSRAVSPCLSWHLLWCLPAENTSPSRIRRRPSPLLHPRHQSPIPKERHRLIKFPWPLFPHHFL